MKDVVILGLGAIGTSIDAQDVETKRKTEVEMFSGKLCELGK